MTDEEESLFITIKHSLGNSADHLSMSQLKLMTQNLLDDLGDNEYVILSTETLDMEETTG